MQAKTCSACLAFICIISLYCGALQYVWPCRQLAVGRELRESPGRSLQETDANCNASDSLSASMLETVNHHSVKFENPWPEDEYISALKRAKRYFPMLVKCSETTWPRNSAGIAAGYHKADRVATLKSILKNPVMADNLLVCPRPHEEHMRLFEEAIASENELDDKLASMEAYLEANPALGGCYDTYGAVHFADLENSLRVLLKKPLLPTSPEYIAEHWVPIVNRLCNDMMNKYGLKDGLTLPSVHTMLVVDQLENHRKLLQSTSLLQVEFQNPWPEESYDSALQRGSLYLRELQECTKREWPIVSAGMVGAYHRRERDSTLIDVLANPSSAENTVVCPKPKALHELLSEQGLENKAELGGHQITLRLHCFSANLECKDVFAAVHFADVENHMRALLSEPQMPMSAEFLGAHWVPIVNRMHDDMQRLYGLKGGLSLPAVHTYLTMDQIEKVRKTRLSRRLAR